jgi:hypothetical protein
MFTTPIVALAYGKRFKSAQFSEQALAKLPHLVAFKGERLRIQAVAMLRNGARPELQGRNELQFRVLATSDPTFEGYFFANALTMLSTREASQGLRAAVEGVGNGAARVETRSAPDALPRITTRGTASRANAQLLQRMQDACARVESMVLIAAALSDAARVPEALEDFLDEEIDDVERTFGRSLPPSLRKCLGNAGQRGDAFQEWAVDNDMLGFLVKVATPVMEWDATGASFSWGYYTTRWVYGETMETAIEAGLSWVEQQRKEERGRFAQVGGLERP